LFDLDRAIVWWENQVNFSAHCVDACHPIKGRIHALFQTVLWIILKLQMHLVKNVFEVEREDIFAEETLHFDRQIHLTEVEEPYR
jgi:hypothetical protein